MLWLLMWFTSRPFTGDVYSCFAAPAAFQRAVYCCPVVTPLCDCVRICLVVGRAVCFRVAFVYLAQVLEYYIVVNRLQVY